MGHGSKTGSGYGGMQIVACPKCGGRFRKSYNQIKSGYPVCINTEKCEKRRLARNKR